MMKGRFLRQIGWVKSVGSVVVGVCYAGAKSRSENTQNDQLTVVKKAVVYKAVGYKLLVETPNKVAAVVR